MNFNAALQQYGQFSSTFTQLQEVPVYSLVLMSVQLFLAVFNKVMQYKGII